MRILQKLYLVIFSLSAILCGCNNGDNNGSNGTPIDYSFMMGISPNYTLLGAPDWKQQIDLVAKYHGNMLRVFAFAGWGDMAGSYVYKPCLGNDLSQIDPNYIKKVKEFVSYANSKGIIVILSLFHNNGDKYAWITHTKGEHQQVYIKALVSALKGLAVIYEPLNEDVDPNFDGFVQSNIKLVDSNAKTCFYALDGATYRIEHTGAKNYIGGRRIQSTDCPQLVNVNNGDMYNISKQAKEQGGHTEFLMYWKRGGGICVTVQDLETEWGEGLRLISQLK